MPVSHVILDCNTKARRPGDTLCESFLGPTAHLVNLGRLNLYMLTRLIQRGLTPRVLIDFETFSTGFPLALLLLLTDYHHCDNHLVNVSVHQFVLTLDFHHILVRLVL